MGPDAMISVFWMLSLKPAVSLSPSTWVRRLLAPLTLREGGARASEAVTPAILESHFCLSAACVLSYTTRFHEIFVEQKLIHIHF